MAVRDKLAKVGVNAKLRATWSRPWLVMWAVISVALLTAAFLLPFRLWFGLAALLFGVPEAYGIRAGKYDAFPPLTHVIRHFLKNYLAFPLIYFFFGSIAAKWLGFRDSWQVGLLFGLLGWLTDHFATTYAAPDPWPDSREMTTPEQREWQDRRGETW